MGIMGLLKNMFNVDTVKGNVNYDIIKPEGGKFAGPLVAQKPKPEPNRINEILSELGYDERIDAIEQLKTVDRQRFSPSYIYEKGYQKSPHSFFNDGYDANADIPINPETIESEFSDFINLFRDDNVKEINKVIGSETISPFANELMPELQRYKEKHRSLPSSFQDFLMNTYSMDV